jgi:hypothetical protein
VLQGQGDVYWHVHRVLKGCFFPQTNKSAGHQADVTAKRLMASTHQSKSFTSQPLTLTPLVVLTRLKRLHYVHRLQLKYKLVSCTTHNWCGCIPTTVPSSPPDHIIVMTRLVKLIDTEFIIICFRLPIQIRIILSIVYFCSDSEPWRKSTILVSFDEMR